MNKQHNVKEIFTVQNPVFESDSTKLFKIFRSMERLVASGKNKIIEADNETLEIRELNNVSYLHSAETGKSAKSAPNMERFRLTNEFLSRQKAAIQAVKEVIECTDEILKRVKTAKEEAVNLSIKIENCESNVVTEIPDFPDA